MVGISEEVARLAEELAAAPARLEGAVDKVVEKGALKIKEAWRADLTGMPTLVHLPHAVGYDRLYEPGIVGAEIGPDHDKMQGPLASIDEFGTSKQPGKLRGARALAAEEEPFVAALEAAIERAVLL